MTVKKIEDASNVKAITWPKIVNYQIAAEVVVRKNSFWSFFSSSFFLNFNFQQVKKVTNRVNVPEQKRTRLKLQMGKKGKFIFPQKLMIMVIMS